MYRGYDPSTPGTQTVTASFLGASATFEVTVEELVTDQYSGEYELVVDDTPAAMAATLIVDHSHKTCTIVSVDGSVSISGTLVEVSDSKLVITLNGSEALDAVIADGRITIPAHQETVYDYWTGSYDIGECTLTLAA